MAVITLTEEQAALITLHKENYQRIRQADIIETWTDSSGYLCVRYSNGEWYHYNTKTKEYW